MCFTLSLLMRLSLLFIYLLVVLVYFFVKSDIFYSFLSLAITKVIPES